MLMRQVLTIARPRIVLDHGTQVKDWAHTDDHQIPGCSIQPGAGAEVQVRRDAASIAWTVWAPPGADVLATDGARIGPDLYMVIDSPQLWTGGSGRLDHVLILLQAWEG